MITRFTTIWLSVSIFFISHPALPAQQVSFVQHDDLLSSIAGFAEYADCIADMNGDYLDDVVRIGGKGIFMDYQQKDGTFKHQAFPIALKTLPSWSIGAGDVNNDGFNDLLLAGSTSVSFLVSNYTGTSYQEYLMQGFIECQRSTMFDINQDRWLDAFVCNEEGQSVPYRNSGDGVMAEDSAFLPTVDLPGNYAAIWTDYNNDGHSDLYITKCLAGALPGDPVRTNGLYKNNGDGTFTEVGAAAGIDDNAQSWSTSFEDFDHDGDFDAFVVNHDFMNRLYRNNGDGTFTDVITSSGINALDLVAFENTTGDFNNDGHMDIFSDLMNRLYLGNGDLTFTAQNAPSIPGAIGDLNQDGFLDIEHQGHVWLNEGNSNHWLNIVPFGIYSNRNGIGARVELYGPWGVQVQEVRSGQSYSPMSSLNVHFGLGENTTIDSLIVRWPSGIKTYKRNNFKPDTTYIIPEALGVRIPSSFLPGENIYFCEGDTVWLTGSPSAMYYLWSNGSENQTVALTDPGNYFVMNFDDFGGVSVSNMVHLEWISDASPMIQPHGPTSFCKGDTLILSVSANPPLLWSTGDTSSQIRVADSGAYTVTSSSVCQHESLISSPVDIQVWTTDPPVISDGMVDAGDSILLSANGENIHWYDDDGNLLHVGPDFQTPVINSSTTYYAESQHTFGGEIQVGGKPDTTGGGGLPAQSGFLYFETWQPFTLQSVSVFVPEGGPLGVRFVQLRTADSLLDFKSFDLHPGENVLDLNFHVGVGKYILDCPQGNLFRNSGNVQYPYSIGQAGRIYGSSHGSDYYYYFYDWKIITDEFTCASERVPVNVIVTGEEFLSPATIFLFPNPAKSFAWLQGANITQDASLEIMEINGRLPEFLYEWIGNIYRLDVSKLNAGLYFLRIKNQDQIQVVKLVIL
ncbi:MAG TPA: FG-GAP-like repeat-containing protein [Saprospiraceae bacterium]|nr:FG-GAP-like repeat-containing protein [Saprospiraceae bacterium]